MLVNWKVEYCHDIPAGKQAPNYYIEGEPYWFYKYFGSDTHVDVIDTSSIDIISKIEKHLLHFYIVQAVKTIPKLRKYDCIVSHSMPRAVAVGLWRTVNDQHSTPIDILETEIY